MQVDIGFDDVITPGPIEVEYPGLLDFPAPVLMAYPRETVVAEKLEALTALGLLNSRMKDYFDLALLAGIYPFDGQSLVRAIGATFARRGPVLDPAPIGLSEAFATDPAREVQWRAFLRRSRFPDEPGALPALVGKIRLFAGQPLAAAAAGAPFEARWSPGGPWT